MQSDLPYKSSDVAPTVNSEVSHKCLFVENPKSKSLEKQVIFKLGPKASVSFVIVIKSPLVKKLDFLSFLTVTHVADGDTDKFCKTRTEKRLSTKQGQLTSCKVKVERQLRVVVIGKLENPVLYCCKGIIDDKVDSSVIPLVVKRGEAI